eukprot:353819-Chlamydomonas_euryale.AAC.1
MALTHRRIVTPHEIVMKVREHGEHASMTTKASRHKHRDQCMLPQASRGKHEHKFMTKASTRKPEDDSRVYLRSWPGVEEESRTSGAGGGSKGCVR